MHFNFQLIMIQLNMNVLKIYSIQISMFCPHTQIPLLIVDFFLTYRYCFGKKNNNNNDDNQINSHDIDILVNLNVFFFLLFINDIYTMNELILFFVICSFLDFLYIYRQKNHHSQKCH